MRFSELETLVLNARSTTVPPADDRPNDTVVNLLIAVFGLFFVLLLCFAVLMLFRRMKRRQMIRNSPGLLPQYHEIKRTGNHRRLTIQTAGGRHSVLVLGGGRSPMLANPHSPPHSPDNVPEIHITFPDEHDEHGRPKSGRVVVVRVGESGAVGMEPLHEEQLPAYEKDSKSQFYAIDIEKIGGLREKERGDLR